MKRLLLLIFIILPFCRALAQTGTFISSSRFSSGLINCICQDREGSIWIATDYGLNRFDGYHFQTFLHDEADTTTVCDNGTFTLITDRDGHLWVGTTHGLDRFDHAKETFVHYPFPDGLEPRVSGILQLADGRILAATAGYGAYLVGSDGKMHATSEFADKDHSDYFSRVFEDSKGRFWKSAYDNVIVMKAGGRFHHFRTKGEPIGIVERDGDVFILGTRGMVAFSNGKMDENPIDCSVLAGKEVLFSDITKDAAGNIYLGTRGHGILRLAAGSRRLENYEANILGANLSTAKIRGLFCDRTGNLWIGLQRKGLVQILQRPMIFNSWNFELQKVNVSSPISSVTEGAGGMIWCTVQGVGVYGFDAKGSIVAHPAAPDAVECIYRDKQNRYWLGTDDGLFAYDPVTGASTLRMTFDSDGFRDMTSDAAGRIYLSAFSRGFCVFDPATGSMKNYRNVGQDTTKKGRLCNDWVMCLAPDHEGCIWMGTASGVACFDPRTESFLSHGWNELLSGVICFSICELKDGNIAIGTDRGMYLYNHNTRQVDLFPGSEQLRNKVVSYIVQSNDGDIWCSTSMGIWQYSTSRKQLIGHVNGNGLTTHEYLYGVGMHTDNDVIYFGQNDGLTVFRPADVKSVKSVQMPLKLSAFIVGNQPVTAGIVLNDVRVTDRPVAESDHFYLSYLDHTVTLGFSQFNFDNPMNKTFEYRVNDGEWFVNPEGKNEFTLNNLQPGTYKVDVRVQDGQGDYTPEKTLTITIEAPWYRSSLAYVVYTILAMWLLGGLVWSYRRRTHRRMDEEKMKFLINATHDIRSPLTLIMSPLNNLKKKLSQSDVDADSDLDTIDRNAKRILDLVNQILDVRKIDKQQMHLHCQKTDLVAFTRSICKMFEYNAQERQIDFIVDCGDLDKLDVWLDRSQFDKVVSNLLSNAFKYTAEQGQVTLRLAADAHNAILQVVDNGVGLDEDSLRHIFDRFYQGGNARRLNIKGTGIGLNLCKMIVDMHHGNISARNRTDGERGSLFTVTLPLGNAHLSADEIEQETTAPQQTPAAVAEHSQETAKPAPKPAPVSSNRPRVLLVDDDEEIGTYISNELGRYYRFHICHNGRDGLKELLASVEGTRYDLVVSDVMMPEMDGFSMLRMIKSNVNISDIPVIMLTSKADVNNRLEGLERGADAFLAKPFNMEELHMNIDNLLRTRQRLKGKYSGAQQQADKVEAPDVKGNDELLMERIMKAINKNLSDSDFNVDMLTPEVGISRAQLHRKMKEMTGISTSEFLRNIRLEQAARLLREQKLNVTQVAYTVGFSNLAHFSTIFRKHFGVAPSEYAEREPDEN